jgi:hypothetical protein
MPLSPATWTLRGAVLLGAALLLSGCAGSAEESLAAETRPAPAARATSAPPPAPRTSAQLPSVDPVIDARGECWVKLDRDRRAPKDLDQRLKLVEKCVADKLAAAPAPAAH